MVNPENPEPPIVPPVPIQTTFFRTAHGFRWSDLVDEMVKEMGSEGDHLSMKEEN